MRKLPCQSKLRASLLRKLRTKEMTSRRSSYRQTVRKWPAWRRVRLFAGIEKLTPPPYRPPFSNCNTQKWKQVVERDRICWKKTEFNCLNTFSQIVYWNIFQNTAIRSRFSALDETNSSIFLKAFFFCVRGKKSWKYKKKLSCTIYVHCSLLQVSYVLKKRAITYPRVPIVLRGRGRKLPPL